VVKIGLLARPTAAAVLAVINVLRSIFGLTHQWLEIRRTVGIERSVAARKKQIKQKETKLTKVFEFPLGSGFFFSEPFENLRFLGYLLLKLFFSAG
jgi:hypothetical protein